MSAWEKAEQYDDGMAVSRDGITPEKGEGNITPTPKNFIRADGYGAIVNLLIGRDGLPSSSIKPSTIWGEMTYSGAISAIMCLSKIRLD